MIDNNKIKEKNSRIYLPRKSNGGIYCSSFLAGTIILMMVILFALYLFLNDLLIVILFSLFTVFLEAILVYITYGFYSMKYILTENELKIKYGLSTKNIPYTLIENLGRSFKPYYRGIRVCGVGIPGYLQGKFRLSLNGKFTDITLFATKLENLILILTNEGFNGKYYGITLNNLDEFLLELKNRSGGIGIMEIDSSKKISSSPEALKYVRYCKFLFLAALILLPISAVYFLFVFVGLPQTIPIHFGFNLIPDSYGPKWFLFVVITFFIGIGITLTLSLHRWVSTSEIFKTPDGYKVMLLPLFINLLFLIINIFIMQLVIQNIVFPVI